MSPSPGIQLGLFCTLAFAAAWAGAELPNRLKLTHARLQVSVSFVAGLMLGLSLLGLTPHAAEILESTPKSTSSLLAGFMLMFFLQRFLPFHHHDVSSGSPLEPCGHAHSLAERSARSLSWAGVAIGLSIHSIFDGLAMAAAVTSDAHGHTTGILGIGTALAVILHKPFGALAITTLMTAEDLPTRWRRQAGLAFAFVTPLGALLFYLGAASLAYEHPAWLGFTLAFCAGTFLCIACADLLPELQFHHHDRFKLSAALLCGLAIAWLITRFGHPEHDHHHEIPGTPSSQPTASAEIHPEPAAEHPPDQIPAPPNPASTPSR